MTATTRSLEYVRRHKDVLEVVQVAEATDHYSEKAPRQNEALLTYLGTIFHDSTPFIFGGESGVLAAYAP